MSVELANDEIAFPEKWRVEYIPTAVFRLKAYGRGKAVLEQKYVSHNPTLPENWYPVYFATE